MPAPLLSIETTATVPLAADVVVIGGGIVGASTAYYLGGAQVLIALARRRVTVIWIMLQRRQTFDPAREVA